MVVSGLLSAAWCQESLFFVCGSVTVHIVGHYDCSGFYPQCSCF